jgi:hypothetical protein
VARRLRRRRLPARGWRAETTARMI